MSRYLLIESRDPYESNALREHVEIAVQLKRDGQDVALFLVQNGVLPVRAGADNEDLQAAFAAGIEVLADEFALRERGIDAAEIGCSAHPASLERVVERMAEGWKVLFL